MSDRRYALLKHTHVGIGGAPIWGSITGTLGDQTDLQAALDGKAATSHTHVEADITDLQAYSLPGHTHTEADITDLGAYLTDAASDGNTYGRKDGAWAVASGGGIADGTVTGALIQWSGSAWVEEEEMVWTGSILRLTHNGSSNLRLNVGDASTDKKQTDIRMSKFFGLQVLAITDSGLNGDVLFSCGRTLDTWQDLLIQTDLKLLGVLKIREQSAANSSEALFGQLWVKDGTPNTLWFTDDTGTDFQIN